MTDWQLIWQTINDYIPWIVVGLLYLGLKFYQNRKRIKRDIAILTDGKRDDKDVEAAIDLLSLVMECAKVLGGTENVKGLLEETIKNGNGSNNQ